MNNKRANKRIELYDYDGNLIFEKKIDENAYNELGNDRILIFWGKRSDCFPDEIHGKVINE